jgi:hypothetical protein
MAAFTISQGIPGRVCSQRGVVIGRKNHYGSRSQQNIADRLLGACN